MVAQHQTRGPEQPAFCPLNPRDKREGDFYIRCYRDSWCVAHGSDAGFMSSVYLASARSHAAKDPESLLTVLSGDEPHRRARARPQARQGGQLRLGEPPVPETGLPRPGPGVQLIGMAEAYFFQKKRTAIRLHVAVTNEHAIGFYHHYGFRDLRIDQA